MTDEPNRSTTGRGLRLALAVSVAFNLAVVGVVGGTMLRPDGPRGHALPRDLGFGFFSEALTPENRAELRLRLKSAAPGVLRDGRQTLRDLTAILVALRTDPFDADALDLAMRAQIERLRNRLEVGQSLLLSYLSDLPVSERLAFADRLEASATNKPQRRGPVDQN